MFEQIVRPFERRPVTATRRVVPSVATGDVGEAVLTWGAAGTVATGAVQEPGVDYEDVGFNIECCEGNWVQYGEPEVEPIQPPIKNMAGTQVGYAEAERIKKITFKDTHKSSCYSDLRSWSYVASGVTEVMAGLKRDIPAASSCRSTYKLNF